VQINVRRHVPTCLLVPSIIFETKSKYAAHLETCSTKLPQPVCVYYFKCVISSRSPLPLMARHEGDPQAITDVGTLDSTLLLLRFCRRSHVLFLVNCLTPKCPDRTARCSHVCRFQQQSGLRHTTAWHT
jgi:hypothetical protein